MRPLAVETLSAESFVAGRLTRLEYQAQKAGYEQKIGAASAQAVDALNHPVSQGCSQDWILKYRRQPDRQVQVPVDPHHRKQLFSPADGGQGRWTED